MEINFKIKLYAEMLRIRCIEEKIAEKYPEGKMRCPTHLSIGQESVPVALSSIINKDDFAVSTHRGHAHYLAKGGSLKKMIAEIHGKVSGCSRGKGGSMHLIDKNVFFMGTSAIVGNSIPLGVGLSLSAKLKSTEQISCIYLGDGAIEEGVFYESINFAILKKLRVLFVCENNLYSVYSPLSVRQPEGRKISEMIKGFGIDTTSCDGNEIISCVKNLNKIVPEIRKECKPHFIEFKTYRWREHCGPNYDNNIGYRTNEEFELWARKDPIKNLKLKILEEDNSMIQNLNRIKREIDDEVNEAFIDAEKAPFPDRSEAYQGLYSHNQNKFHLEVKE